MISLYRDPWFTFRFAEDRQVPRFQLAGEPAGRKVSIHAADPRTLQPLQLLGTAIIGEDGWVDLASPIIVRAGEVFVVYPEGDRT